MALVFQPMPHDVVGDGPEDDGEQDQDSDGLVEAHFLTRVHVFITVLSCCTILVAVLQSNVAKKLIWVRVSAVISDFVVARKLFPLEAEDCVDTA